MRGTAPRLAGILAVGPGRHPLVQAFEEGMRDLGWSRVDVQIRYAQGKADRLPELAAELAALPVDAFVVAGTPSTKAARQATSTIPIVIAVAGHLVSAGLVTPGGNATGWDLYSPEFARAQVDVFREVVPGARRLALVRTTAVPATRAFLEQVRAAAASVDPGGTHRRGHGSRGARRGLHGART